MAFQRNDAGRRHLSCGRCDSRRTGRVGATRCSWFGGPTRDGSCDAKGRHPAGLNFGDSMTFGVAVTLGLPILCIGNDFAPTDVAVVGP